MNPLKMIGKVLQKPQSIAMGLLAAGDPLYEEVTRERLLDNFGVDYDRGDILKKGITGSISPSDFWTEEARTSLPGKINAIGTNAAYDPMWLAGPAAKALTAGTKLGALGTAANTFGKLGEGATKGEKAAQVARRFLQGTVAGGGDATYGLGYAALGGPAERILQSAVTRAASKMGTKAAGQLVGEGVEEALSTPAVDKLAKGMSTEEAMRLAAVPHIQPTDASYAAGMRNASDTMDSALDSVIGRYPDPTGPGANIEKWKPTGQVPVEKDPVVLAAREYFSYNPDATVTDAIFDLNLPKGVTSLVEQARIPRVVERVPFSDRGALFNDQLMKNGMPKPDLNVVPPTIEGIDRLPPELLFPPMDINNPVFSPRGTPSALNAAPVATPMPATTGKAVERFAEELPPMQPYDVPMGSGTWDLSVGQPAPKALNAAPNVTPVGAVPANSSPYVRYLNNQGITPQQLAMLARSFRSNQPTGSLPAGPAQEDKLLELLKQAIGG